MTQQLLAPGFTNITPNAVDEISRRHDEPAWLRERRTDAWRAYEAMDFPAESDEEWRRTDVRSIVFNGVRPFSEAQTSAAKAAPAQGDSGLAGHLLQGESEAVGVELRDDLRAKGVIVTDLHTAAR